MRARDASSDRYDPVEVIGLLVVNLMIAVVLFTFLDSTAAIGARGWSTSGALAGFVVTTLYSFRQLNHMRRRSDSKEKMREDYEQRLEEAERRVEGLRAKVL